MKTVTKLLLASITAAFFTTAGAFADTSEWIAIDNHHGSVIYLHRPSQKETTVALYAHGKAIGSADDKANRGKLRLMQRSTSHGMVSYFAPDK